LNRKFEYLQVGILADEFDLTEKEVFVTSGNMVIVMTNMFEEDVEIKEK
jgi:hypothetical protein